MNAKEAAEYLRTTRWFILEKIRLGELSAKRIGNRYVMTRKALDEFFVNAEDAV